MYLVTGMHRSGTSLTTMILSAIGAPLGDPQDMIGADHWNKSGYFENQEAVKLNLQLLLGVGINTNIWIDPPVRPLHRLISFFTSPKWRYFLPCSDKDIRRRAQQISPDIKAFSQENIGIFVKDPRFAITHLAWMEHATIEGVILAFRNPDSVARSIRKRDLIPKFISLSAWYKYNAAFLMKAKPDLPLLLVDYDQFFGENSQEYISNLATTLSEKIELTKPLKNIGKLINSEERHHDEQFQDHLPKKIQKAYKALKLCAHENPRWITIGTARKYLG